jgi:hypothetical protein
MSKFSAISWREQGLSGNKHVLCWGLEDMLASPEKEAKDKDKEKSKG